MMRLRELSAQEYAANVLPQTAKLWAGRRDFRTYADQTLEIAQSAYGRRNYRSVGLYDGSQLVASMKRYARGVRFREERLRGFGIGAVFTPKAFRGRGYASAMLAMMLDQAKEHGDDFAYLFSDIRPQFYAELGFASLPSRTISLRADSLAHRRIIVSRLEDTDWNGVRRCFDAGERDRTWSFTRPPLVWDWLRLRMRLNCEHPIGTDAHLVIRRGRTILAYVFGMRAPERDAYLLDEFGYADDAAAALVPALLRSAAGDLRRIIGWLPLPGARELLPHGSIRKRTDAISMVAPLSARGKRWLALAQQPSSADGIWSTEHI